jgi:hypothetical protein
MGEGGGSCVSNDFSFRCAAPVFYSMASRLYQSSERSD